MRWRYNGRPKETKDPRTNNRTRTKQARNKTRNKARKTELSTVMRAEWGIGMRSILPLRISLSRGGPGNIIVRSLATLIHDEVMHVHDSRSFVTVHDG